MSSTVERLRAHAALVVSSKDDIMRRLKEVGELERKCMDERWELQSALKAIELLESKRP